MSKKFINLINKLQNKHIERVSDGGERVSHLYPNDTYYAHLSIYHFASQFCKGKDVLDAGSGSGYGSAYLLEHGARSVEAFDVEKKAVMFSRHYFSRPGLMYHVMNIESITGFPKKHFDVLFTSNALEHVPNVFPFFYSAWELLKPDGILIVAVPPVISDLHKISNLDNLYHLNIWSPRQWFHVLELFFLEVQPYLHYCKEGIRLNLTNIPEQSHVRETDFSFEPIHLDDFYLRDTLTAIFVVRRPKVESELPSKDSIPSFIDDSFTRSTSGYTIHLTRLIKRGWKTLRQKGWKALIIRVKEFILSALR